MTETTNEKLTRELVVFMSDFFEDCALSLENEGITEVHGPNFMRKMKETLCDGLRRKFG
jgi:hypothetical protein